MKDGTQRYGAWWGVWGLIVLTLAAVIITPIVIPSRSTEDPTRNDSVVVIGMSGVPWSGVDARTPHLAALAQAGAIANISVRTSAVTTCADAGWLTFGAGTRARGFASDDASCARANEVMATIDRSLEQNSATGSDHNNSHTSDAVPVPPAQGHGQDKAMGGSSDITQNDQASQNTGQNSQTSQDKSQTAGQNTGTSSSTEPIAQWVELQKRNRASSFHPQLGVLAHKIIDAGYSVAGVGPGAALALADHEGNPLGPIRSSGLVDGVASSAAEAYRQVKAAHLVVVDLGSAYKDSSPGNVVTAAFIPPGDISTATRAAVSRIDAELGRVLAEIPAGTDVIVMSVGDADRTTSRLQLYASARAPIAPVTGDDMADIDDIESQSVATSPATRQSALIRNVDITAEVLARFGISASGDIAGTPVRYETGGTSIAHLEDVSERAVMTRGCVGHFYTIFIVGAVLAIVNTARTIRRRRLGAHHVLSMYWVAALPVSSFLMNLVPWWHAQRYAAVSFFAMLFGCATVLGLIALRIGWRESRYGATFLAAITALTIGVDALLGSPLHSISVLGDQPQSGGRFYGISNAPFAIFAVAMLLVATQAVRVLSQRAEKISAPLGVGLIGLIAVIIDGTPAIGADFGGVPPFIIGFAVFALLAWGQKITWLRLLVIGLAGAAGAIGVAFLDWLRPASSRTHLGQFFESLRRGKAADIVLRKADQVITQVPWIGWLGAVIMIVLLVMQYRMVKRYGDGRVIWDTQLRRSFLAGVILLGCALLINDSGIVIPVIGGAYMALLWAVSAICSSRSRIPVSFHGASV
ncbi:hypothetical protein [Trueperella sp. LYQ143]|uniref:hypothetical protein n=1 Tax=Trueperella sp. LYQ143 TaxID=3391059 RepID=UPI003983A3E6